MPTVHSRAALLGAILTGMDMHKTTLERAFEIARSGECLGILDLIKRLDREGYQTQQNQGAQLKKQLTHLIEEAKSSHARPP
jgi:hypothetical protein